MANLALPAEHLIRLLEHEDLLLQIGHAFQLVGDRRLLGHQLVNAAILGQGEAFVFIFTVLLLQRDVILLKLAHLGAQLVLLLLQVLYLAHLALEGQIDAFRAVATVVEGLFLVALHALVVLDLVLIHRVLLKQCLDLLCAPVQFLLYLGGHKQAF